MSCHVMMLPAELLLRINLMNCPLTLASVYIVVIGLASRAAQLNNDIIVVSSNLNGKIAAKDLSSVMVVGEILLVSGCFWVNARLLVEASSGVTRRLK
ncbi:hypothetical protein G9A89_012424 [Geosiphon pyriformis]|nr:hypothetical protein G9A89_012424 [Geosiphon pyriformis]